MLSPSKPFIERPVATSLLMLAIVLAGLVGFRCIPGSPQYTSAHRHHRHDRRGRRRLKALCVALLAVAFAAAGSAVADMVSVPAGPFTMGRDDGPADERPAHVVDVAHFAIDRMPVTNAQFAEFLNAVGLTNASGERLFDHDDRDARIRRRQGKWTADAGYENHPVVEMPWAGARDYCAWRGKRLPTEAEWEKAARGNDQRRYPWGNAAPDRTRAAPRVDRVCAASSASSFSHSNAAAV